MTESDWDSSPLPKLPPRDPPSHKGDFGHVLLVGGSRGMSGAIVLAGVAALRGGAGLVRLATPDVCQDVVAAAEPSYLTAALASDRDGRISEHSLDHLLEMAAAATVIGCGPGLGRSDGLMRVVAALYSSAAQPAVFDADALNALAADRQALLRPGGPRVLTPHPGEFRRLLAADRHAEPESLSREALEREAVRLAEEWSAVIVLKGHRSLITDGKRRAHNQTGNPGLATGGTGDVLTGLIAALLAQGLAPYDAARLGAHVHGLAGDLAAAEFGQVSLIASDLPRYVAAVLRSATPLR